ncbi:MAG: methyltransferase domain-containing protein [Streptosporangiales bacterium]|nr:methyltransferase domain-containing protein [Streptosporangiales bacterium]
MLADVMAYLRCPHCAGELTLVQRSVRCTNGHTFDVARHGYVSLLRGDARGDAGDSAAMVRAREEFLAAGHYAPVAELVIAMAGAAGCVVDVGAGTGYYLAHTVARLPGCVGLALDVSKYACRRAAKAHPRLGAVACDVWRQLPVATDAADVVLDVFAPRNGAEFHRVLRPDGRLVVVTPTQRHLGELVSALGLLTVAADKEQRVADKLDEHFELAAAESFDATVALDRDLVAAAVAMGPSAWHTDRAELADKIARLADRTPVTFSVTCARYLPRPGNGSASR